MQIYLSTYFRDENSLTTSSPKKHEMKRTNVAVTESPLSSTITHKPFSQSIELRNEDEVNTSKQDQTKVNTENPNEPFNWKIR